MSQSTYSENPAGALEGQSGQEDLGGEITKIANAAIGFGLVVTHVAASGSPGKAALPAAGADVTNALGVAMLDPTKETSANGYDAGDVMRIKRRGIVHVKLVGTGCTAHSDEVFVPFQNGDEGTVRNDNDAGDAAKLPGAVFLDDGVAGDIVRVELNPTK